MSGQPIQITGEDILRAIAAEVHLPDVMALLQVAAREAAELVPLADEPGNEGLRLLQAANVKQAKAVMWKKGIPLRMLGRKKAYFLRGDLLRALGCAPGEVCVETLVRGKTSGGDGMGAVVAGGTVSLKSFHGSNEPGSRANTSEGMKLSAARGNKAGRGGIQLRKGDRV